MVQWFELRPSTARGTVLISDKGTNTLRAMLCGQKKRGGGIIFTRKVCLVGMEGW